VPRDVAGGYGDRNAGEVRNLHAVDEYVTAGDRVEGAGALVVDIAGGAGHLDEDLGDGKVVGGLNDDPVAGISLETAGVDTVDDGRLQVIGHRQHVRGDSLMHLHRIGGEHFGILEDVAGVPGGELETLTGVQLTFGRTVGRSAGRDGDDAFSVPRPEHYLVAKFAPVVPRDDI